MKQPYVSVVVPAYNEGTNIRLGVLDKVLHYLERQSYLWEVIVVNDGSTDDTKKLLDDFCSANKGFSLVNNSHQGKAMTIMTGMLKARGDIILFTDLDQATPIAMLGRVLPWFSRGFDVVIGSRQGRREGAPLLRFVMARGFMMLRSTILGLNGIEDTQCGFKAFRKHVISDIFSRLRLYHEHQQTNRAMVTPGFDIELLFIAKKLGYKIKEVPVEWHYVETRRVNPLRDSLQGLTDIIRIRWNAMRGQYA